MKQEASAVTDESMRHLYDQLLGDAVVIQPVNADHYDIIDVAYDLYAHWCQQYKTPMPRVKCLTRRNLTLAQCVRYAEVCIKEVRKPARFTYHQNNPLGGARRTTLHGAAKEVNKSNRAQSH